MPENDNRRMEHTALLTQVTFARYVSLSQCHISTRTWQNWPLQGVQTAGPSSPKSSALGTWNVCFLAACWVSVSSTQW